MRIPIFRALLLACALSAAAAPAPAQEPLAVLPFWSPSNLIVLRGSIGDADSLLVLLLDSGAGRSVVDAPLVDTLGLQVTGQGQAVGASGRAAVRVLGAVTMHLGEYPGLPQGSVDLAVPMPVSIDFAELEPALGWDIDAVVGHELFARYVVQIDYAAGLLLRGALRYASALPQRHVKTLHLRRLSETDDGVPLGHRVPT